MKSKEKKQVQGKTIAELGVDCAKVIEELTVLLLDKAQGKLKNTSSLANKRREIAFLKTVMNEKRLLEGSSL